jgi:hypothetical protein
MRETILKSGHLEDRKGDGKVTLRSILEKQVVRTVGGSKWLRIVSNGNNGVVPSKLVVTIADRAKDN